MEKYYLMAIEKGCVDSMNNLGCYYQNIKIYDLSIKYFTLAADNGNIRAIFSLANYYRHINNYDLMKKYYLMAIEKECIEAMNKMYLHYKNIEKNQELMDKYYSMSINTFKNKLKFTSNDQCVVCWDVKDLYEHRCGRHSFCVECYYSLVYIFNKPHCSLCRGI
jgi:TPR repeat protein